MSCLLVASHGDGVTIGTSDTYIDNILWVELQWLQVGISCFGGP